MMDVAQSVAELIDSTSSRIQQLQNAFTELESHRSITLNFKWKELEEHFHGLQRSLKRRFIELEDQEKELENKKSEAREMLEKREASIVAKEQASLDMLQEKRDAAVLALDRVLERDQISSNCGAHEKLPDEAAVKCCDGENINIHGLGSMGGKCDSPLGKLCEEMDSNGLHKFISENRKNLAALREELPLALKMARDPACLVINLLEDFYRIEDLNVDAKKDSDLLGLRRTCIMLMECLTILLFKGMKSGTECLPILVSEDARQRARALAENWKLKLSGLDVDGSNGNSLEAHAFLQLLVTFGIYSDFNQELSRLVPAVSRRRQAPDLCRLLGLSHRMPGVIEALVNSRRHINAVNLVIAFGLTEQFSPVDLLKSYLKAVKDGCSPSRPGNASPLSNDADDRELAAYKAVLKCVEIHELGKIYPVEPLHEHIVKLEKAKAEKKVSETAKSQSKRPRANMPSSIGLCATTIIADKSLYTRVSDRPPQFVYDRQCAYPIAGDTTRLTPYAYNFTSAHGNYFGYPYQYQPQYLY